MLVCTTPSLSATTSNVTPSEAPLTDQAVSA
jgi:hypothetical protein